MLVRRHFFHIKSIVRLYASLDLQVEMKVTMRYVKMKFNLLINWYLSELHDYLHISKMNARWHLVLQKDLWYSMEDTAFYGSPGMHRHKSPTARPTTFPTIHKCGSKK